MSSISRDDTLCLPWQQVREIESCFWGPNPRGVTPAEAADDVIPIVSLVSSLC